MATTSDGLNTEPPLKAKGEFLNKVSKTMLITLTGRAKDARQPNPILNDTWAVDILDKLDYTCRPSLIEGGGFASMILRAHLFDAWVVEFLNANPESTVLHLACGLDSRALRLALGPRVRWIDIDMPDVVAMRRELLPDPAANGADYRLIGLSITDDGWLQGIPADRPTLVVMEGLIPYLDDTQITHLLERISERFPSGQIVFDIIGTLVRRLNIFSSPLLSMTNLMRSASNDGREYANVSSKLIVKDVLRFWQLPACSLLPWYMRLYFWTASWIPGPRTLMSFLRYEF